MAGYERELTAALVERGQLTRGEHILAAWSGELRELGGSGSDLDLSEPVVAVLGVTEHSGHLLSRLGALSFELADVRSPHSPHSGYLRFTVHQQERPRIDVGMALEGAYAIAEQLREAVNNPPPARVPTVSMSRRPRAKRRGGQPEAGPQVE